MEKIILASASPRRREILNAVGIEFEVVKSDADENAVSKELAPEIYVQELALLKATDAAKKLKLKNRRDMLIISADTIVVSEGEILGKPEDEADAKRILLSLSGKQHKVITGICVTRLNDAFSVCKSVVTKVKFRELGEEEIDKYIASGEPMDKAGAYGIQGKGALLTDGIEGDYFNVVGLPVSKLCEVLRTEFNYSI